MLDVIQLYAYPGKDFFLFHRMLTKHILLIKALVLTGNSDLRESISTVDLLLLNTHLLILKLFQYCLTKTSFLNKEVNRTETFLSEGVPCCCHFIVGVLD